MEVKLTVFTGPEFSQKFFFLSINGIMRYSIELKNSYQSGTRLKVDFFFFKILHNELLFYYSIEKQTRPVQFSAWGLKILDTIGNRQRQVFSLGVISTFIMHKITNL